MEELGDVPAVVSSKHPSQVFDAPAGAFVFDQADLQNRPVDSIAELLRYAPGVHISRPSNGIWGVGIRGINSRFFNRVQFTVDEQNVYSSIFAGLFGNQHDLLMDDVAAVEVAYGPQGGTWDNNAVNGMVNVLMKTAFETEGTLLKGKLGTEASGAEGRIGWAIDDTSSARVYFKAGSRDSGFTRFDYSNRWDTARAGFRLDKRTPNQDLLSISGEAFYSYLGYGYDLANLETGALDFTDDAEMLRGVSSQAKWTRDEVDGSGASLRGWLSYSELEAAYAAFDMVSGGVEARARKRLSDRRFLNLNLGVAFDFESTFPTLTSDWTSDSLDNHAVYGGFQDEWTFQNERLKASWGLDLRYEDKSAITTTSPNARIVYQLCDSDRIWASYSQAERTSPVALSVIQSLRSGKAIDPINITVPQLGSFVLNTQLADAVSDTELDVESLDAFEVGYRRNFDREKGYLSINAFSYRYDGIFARIGEFATPELLVPEPYLFAQITYDNLFEGEAYGFETALQWNFTEAFEATLTYSHLKDSFDPLIESANPFVAGSIQFSQAEFDNSTPEQMATLSLSADLSEEWNLHTGFRYTESYPFAKGLQPAIFQADARLSWQASERTRLSLVGRNLLNPKTQDIRLKDFFGHWAETARELYLEVSAEF